MKMNKFMIVFDRSGSMYGIFGDAIRSLNENIEQIKKGAASFPDQMSFLGVLAFSDNYEVVRDVMYAEQVSKVSDNQIRCTGGTALFDAVMAAKRLLQKPSDPADTSYVVIVITDGEENKSRFCLNRDFLKLMREVNESDNWTVSFMLPQGGYKSRFCHSFEVPEGNCSEWETSVKGLKNVVQTIGSSVYRHYNTRATVASYKKSTSFLVDPDQLTKALVKENLKDLTSKVKWFPVFGNNRQIRDVVEDSLGLTYAPGEWYYRLMKSEKIQPYKQILIKDLSNGKFYGGQDARDLLGLPSHEARVAPSKYAQKFEIYVQSTSVNRKVVPGMSLVFYQ